MCARLRSEGFSGEGVTNNNKTNKNPNQLLKLTWSEVNQQKEPTVLSDRLEKGGCDVTCI